MKKSISYRKVLLSCCLSVMCGAAFAVAQQDLPRGTGSEALLRGQSEYQSLNVRDNKAGSAKNPTQNQNYLKRPGAGPVDPRQR